MGHRLSGVLDVGSHLRNGGAHGLSTFGFSRSFLLDLITRRTVSTGDLSKFVQGIRSLGVGHKEGRVSVYTRGHTETSSL